MRWPIKRQLLLPNLLVVLLAIVSASGAGAYFHGVRARRNQEENLDRLTATLAEGKFPLTEEVLRQMSGLSGAEFVVLGADETVEAATLPFDRRDLERLRAAGAASDEPVQSTLTANRQTFRCRRVAVAARPPLETPRALIVLYPEDRWTAVMWQAASPMLAVGALAALAVGAVSAWTAHRFVRPIHSLSQQAAAVARGEFRPVALPRRDDEIRDLALSIHRMTEQLARYEDQVRRNEQLRTLGRLSAGLAHQLRNAATGARMAIELHERECPMPPPRESLAVALRQLQLMESYLQRFLAVGRDHPAAMETLSLSAAAAEALALMRPGCEHVGVELVFREPPEPIHVRGDADALRQLVLNLTLNAVDAASLRGDAPRVTVAVERRAAGRAALHVSDTGPGLSPEVAERLFEPFVSGKPHGAGLGLYVARQVAEAHQGAIHWERIGGETRFSVVFPPAAES